MKFSLIKYERRGRAAWIVYNDPENMNAISPTQIAEVGEALTMAERDPDVAVVVLTGTGRAFCAGANLKVNSELLADDVDRVVNEFLVPLKQLLRRYRESRKPVIAAVNGFCMAGGMETLLCCDLVVAVEGALMGDQHATFGLLPAVGGAQGLIRTLGMMRAKEMMFTGGRYTAQQLLDWGLVNKVVPAVQLQDAVDELVELLAQRSPAGLARMKQMANDEAEMPWEASTRYELALTIGHLTGGDVQEGMQAFIDKRAPKFKRL
ncbi:putative enoyl-CoA hydratase echA8 [compost metagenome]|uniref:enoyl-CoA hydratase/isomerase family protein n=1 Tax=Cupriavidus necator TaxID=106590 RepID=UPI0028B8A4E2